MDEPDPAPQPPEPQAPLLPVLCQPDPCPWGPLGPLTTCWSDMRGHSM